MTKDKCADKVQASWESTREDLSKLIEAYENDKNDPELGNLYDYGLSIDVVEAGTFEDQRADYIRYLFSWGGPSEELRIYKNGDIEYWYLDWFDGACIDVTGDTVAEWVKDWVEGLDFWNKR